MEEPLENLLKIKEYLEIARLQDEIITAFYSSNTSIILHGGTAIWRCYGGKRFSYDLDIYIKNSSETQNLLSRLYKIRLPVIKLRTRKSSGPVYYSVSNGIAKVTIEFKQKRNKGEIIATYSKTDGSYIDILSLSPEDLIKEKLMAYSSRRAIKDIYDIFVLSHISEKEKIRKDIKRFVENLKQPVDENSLPQLIYTGSIPTFKQMIEYLKRTYEIYK